MILGFTLYAASQAQIAIMMQQLSDALNTFDRSYLDIFPMLVVGLFIVRGLGSFLGTYSSGVISRNVVYVMRVQVFEKILKLPMSFFMKESGGKTSAKLVYNVEQVTAAGTDALKVIVRDGLTVIGLVGYLFYTNWKLSLTLFLIIPMVAGIVAYASKRFRRLSGRVQQSMGDVSHIVNEVINAIDVVKNNSGQEQELARFDRASKNNLRQGLKIIMTDSVMTPLIQLILACGLAFVVWLALTPEILGDNESPGVFFGYITAIGLLSSPVKALTQVNAKIQRGIAGADSIFSMIDSAEEADTGTLTPDIRGQIDFKDISLRYDDGTEALKNINLSIKAGESVALVGRSGAGKSSLVHLLTRQFEATSGTIEIDGAALQNIKLSSLREQIAVVSQRVNLFASSVRDNIAYGRLSGKSMSEIESAARSAFADQFIKQLPNGYDSQLSAGGEGLSGGQRQRIAIARGLLKDAPILILDEATSALDNESEHYIQEAIETLKAGRTTLMIAHRLTSIEQADRIVVMDRGQIIEIGNHEELMKLGGTYSSMYERDFADQQINPS